MSQPTAKLNKTYFWSIVRVFYLLRHFVKCLGSLKRFRDLIDFRTLNPNPIIELQLKIRRIHRIHRRIHTRIRYAGIKSDVLQYGDFRFFLFQHQPTVLPGSLARTKSAECQCPSPPLLPWYNGLLRISRKRRRW